MFPKRITQQQVASATAESGAAAEASSAAPFSSTVSEADMRAAAKAASAWMFPWERRQLDGKGPLRWWEKLYWGVFVGGLAFLLISRMLRKQEPEEDPEVKAAREASKRERARLALLGDNFISEEEDVFEGMNPTEIQEYIKTTTGGATKADPFEGMSPEEINEYLEKHKGSTVDQVATL